MSEHWINFSIVILVQFVLFIVHAWYEKRLREVPRILGLSIAIGIPFGVVFDLVVGKFLSFYDYKLGFGLFFLTINGAFSFGLMQANTLLMEKVSFLHFYLWTIFVGLVYEITNHLHRVWTWDFGTQFIELFVVHAFGYIGLALLMALTWHTSTRHRFAFISNFLGRRSLS
jgi:hypothetical protein